MQTAFIISTDLLAFSWSGSADTKSIHDCLLGLLSRMGLELKHLKAFSSDGASVMSGVNTSVDA